MVTVSYAVRGSEQTSNVYFKRPLSSLMYYQSMCSLHSSLLVLALHVVMYAGCVYNTLATCRLFAEYTYL